MPALRFEPLLYTPWIRRKIYLSRKTTSGSLSKIKHERTEKFMDRFVVSNNQFNKLVNFIPFGRSFVIILIVRHFSSTKSYPIIERQQIERLTKSFKIFTVVEWGKFMSEQIEFQEINCCDCKACVAIKLQTQDEIKWEVKLCKVNDEWNASANDPSNVNAQQS